MSVNERGECRECGCPSECGRNAADDRIEELENVLRAASKRLWRVANRAKLDHLGLISPMMDALQDIDASLAAPANRDAVRAYVEKIKKGCSDE